MHRLIFLVLLITVSCSSADNNQRESFAEVEVDAISVLLNVETTNEIGAPAMLASESDGFLVYDYGLEKIHAFDVDGNKQFSFGRKGRGPGEFQSVYDYWVLDQAYLVYDYNSSKLIEFSRDGEWIRDIPVKAEGFPLKRPRNVEALRLHQFLIAADGENESLFKLIHTQTDSIQYYGDALAEPVTSMDTKRTRQQILSGNIPANIRNAVGLTGNDTGIFCFQQTTGMLEKFDYSGELLWKKNLKIPAVDGLFEQIFQINRERINEGKPPSRSLAYARDMYANKNGVGILLKGIEGEPVKVVWVPNDGKNGTIVTFTGLENLPYEPGNFILSESESYIFFVNQFEGKIYRAEWPI